MYLTTVSDPAAFKAALKQSHTVVTKVEVLSVGNVVKTITSAVRGVVTVERSAAVRRRVELTLVDPDRDLVPTSAGSFLAPYGNELRVWRGLRLSSGDELVPLGVFRISRVRVRDTDDGLTINVVGYDRSRAVARNRFTVPYIITSGQNYGTAIKDLMRDRLSNMPWVALNFDTVSATTGGLVFQEADDPFARGTAMAESVGCELYFDPMGECRLQTVTNDQTPVWTYAEGAEATFLEVERDLGDERTYNGVIVTGEAPDLDVPVRAEAWDKNTVSPTFWEGPFGKVPYFQVSQFIRTTAQAQTAADARLTKVIGATEQVSLHTIVNPAHEPGDVISITRAAAGVGTSNSLFVIDDLTIPLSAADVMEIRVRERRSLS